MIDYEKLNLAIYSGIRDGLQDGAVYIERALAKPAPGTVGLEPFQNGVTLKDVTRALSVVVAHHTDVLSNGTVFIAKLDGYEKGRDVARDAWAILRRAIGATT